MPRLPLHKRVAQTESAPQNFGTFCGRMCDAGQRVNRGAAVTDASEPKFPCFFPTLSAGRIAASAHSSPRLRCRLQDSHRVRLG
jgi:hypothetical protein